MIILGADCRFLVDGKMMNPQPQGVQVTTERGKLTTVDLLEGGRYWVNTITAQEYNGLEYQLIDLMAVSA
jgi:hypothetical protein